MNRPNLLTEAQAAEFLGVSTHFLRLSRVKTDSRGNRTGPPFVRVGARAVRYKQADLDRYVRERREVVQ